MQVACVIWATPLRSVNEYGALSFYFLLDNARFRRLEWLVLRHAQCCASSLGYKASVRKIMCKACNAPIGACSHLCRISLNR